MLHSMGITAFDSAERGLVVKKYGTTSDAGIVLVEDNRALVDQRDRGLL
ncbi:hypothetical protein ACFU67_23725 [Streptomyces rhizosphaericola]|nr:MULTISPECIES: hypothetical protein [unclassified Streptomyces]MYT95076.1 hypothetical protein [Streptomyces sp. SID8359]